MSPARVAKVDPDRAAADVCPLAHGHRLGVPMLTGIHRRLASADSCDIDLVQVQIPGLPSIQSWIRGTPMKFLINLLSREIDRLFDEPWVLAWPLDGF